MADKPKPQPIVTPQGAVNDDHLLANALREREANLKEQIKRTEALPETHEHRAQNLSVLKQHLSDLQKDLK